jgi:phenazine biosynthesis protein phzE
LLAEQWPFLAVCLSHQILCLELGLTLIQRDPPNQGVQREIDFFGRQELVGFYNTYVAQCDQNSVQCLRAKNIEVSREPNSNEVHSLRGPHFVSLQFHAESLLTRNGIDIIAASVKRIINL